MKLPEMFSLQIKVSNARAAKYLVSAVTKYPKQILFKYSTDQSPYYSRARGSNEYEITAEYVEYYKHVVIVFTKKPTIVK